MQSPQRPWWQQTWAIILFLIVFFPVGLFIMWRTRPWSTRTMGIVTGIVAVLFVVAVVSGSSPEPTDEGIEDAAAQVETEETGGQSATQAPTQEPTQAPTAEPTEPPTPTATPTPEPPQNQKKIGNLLLTVNSWVVHVDNLFPADPGTYYVAVDITARNDGNGTYALNALNFHLKDSDGYTNEGALTEGPEPQIGHHELVPGQEVRGWLVFKVGEGRDPVELQYQSFTGTPGTISLEGLGG